MVSRSHPNSIIRRLSESNLLRMGWSFSAPACPVRDVLGQAGKEIMELALQKKSWRTMSTYTDRTKEGSCSFLEYLHLLSTVPLLLQHSVNSSMPYICQ